MTRSSYRENRPMKSFAMLVLCAVTFAASAQTPAPAPTTAPGTTGENPSARDPRACLEFATRQQVIACAEKYRPRRPAPKQ
jgi:hypothetical protein